MSVDEFINKFDSEVIVGEIVYDYEVEPELEKDIADDDVNNN